MQYEPHEYANLFPMMRESEYQELLDSMKKNGYFSSCPIILFESAILDGRNRYRAAQELNILPMFVQFAGDKFQAYEYARATNFAHKHWTDDQLSVIALDLMPYETELAKQRKSAGGKTGGGDHKSAEYKNQDVAKQPHLDKDKKREPPARAKVAQKTGVSESKVKRAQAVKNKDEKLADAVKQGTMTLADAEKKVKAQERDKKRVELAQAGAMVAKSDKWHVYQGDIRTWDAPRQYDFIITDPPYPREFLPLWETLAERAAKWLKPGGLLIAMSGQSYLDEIYAMMSKHLQYYWTSAYLTPGAAASLRQKQVNTQWKPLLIYGLNEDKYSGKIFNDVFTSGENDKDHHKWGQSVSGMTDIVSKVCLEGQYILDPFCGAGTTGIAALNHNCFFDGVELLEENVNISRARLSE